MQLPHGYCHFCRSVTLNSFPPPSLRMGVLPAAWCCSNNRDGLRLKVRELFCSTCCLNPQRMSKFTWRSMWPVWKCAPFQKRFPLHMEEAVTARLPSQTQHDYHSTHMEDQLDVGFLFVQPPSVRTDTSLIITFAFLITQDSNKLGVCPSV